MAVGIGIEQPLLPVSGISIGVGCAGIKEPGRQDLVIFDIAHDANTGAVFTKNAFCAAPVELCKKHLDQTQSPRFLIINTGNANAGTGSQGMDDAIETCTRLAAKKSVEVSEVLPFSTGVIGEYLPMDALIGGIPQALESSSPDNWLDAATGIMTTDTRPKGDSRQFEFEDTTITVTGISKGAGMIKPNMATMLAFVATDAAVEPSLLQKMTAEATKLSFNRITVDSDTSTNDSCVLVATGKAEAPLVDSENHPMYAHLLKTVKEVMLSLAQQIIRDGEGASKYIEVKVKGSSSETEALSVAYSVAESPLFKTAMSASDANWGRILMAVGKADVTGLDVNKVDVWLGDVQIVQNGERAAGYTEEQGSAVVENPEICVEIQLNRGDVEESVWTSDLSHDYVTINAEYRT